VSYVTLVELRVLPNLDDTVKFTDAELMAATTWFETKFEHYTGVAWEPRAVAGEIHDGGRSSLMLDRMYPRSVTAVSVTSDSGVITAFTADELADLRWSADGELRRVARGIFLRGDDNIAVDYTHAKTLVPPADVVEAGLVAIRDKVLTDNAGNRQFAVVTQDGIVRSSSPGPDRPFGIPFVDEVANARSERVPGFA
jgi:hypothetical protein